MHSLFIKSLWPWCNLHLQNISVWISLISGAQQLHAARGSSAGQHNPIISSLFPSLLSLLSCHNSFPSVGMLWAGEESGEPGSLEKTLTHTQRGSPDHKGAFVLCSGAQILSWRSSDSAEDFQQQRVVIIFAFQKGSSIGNGLQAGQAEAKDQL